MLKLNSRVYYLASNAYGNRELHFKATVNWLFNRVICNRSALLRHYSVHKIVMCGWECGGGLLDVVTLAAGDGE